MLGDGDYVVPHSLTIGEPPPLGPAIIGKNCRIGPGAYIRENVIVGDNCVVGNSVELKHCLLFNGCQVPHYNYIGESVLGYKAHLGAGAICSNWKLMPTAHVFVYVMSDGGVAGQTQPALLLPAHASPSNPGLMATHDSTRVCSNWGRCWVTVPKWGAMRCSTQAV